MDCDQIRDYLEEYALELLPSELHHEVESHLADCPDCSALVAQYADLLAALPDALQLAAPVPLAGHTKQAVLAEIERRKQHTDVLQSGDKQSAAIPQNRRKEPVGESKRDPDKRRRHLWQLRLGLAAAALLLILLLVWSIRLNVVLARERALRAEFSNLVDQQELVLEVIDSNATERRLLLPDEAASPTQGDVLPPYGKVYTRAEMPYVVAMAARLSDPPSGQAYQLWLTQDGKTELAGTLNINEDGFGLIVYQAADTQLAYESAMVTLQEVGSTSPVLPPILTWEAEP